MIRKPNEEEDEYYFLLVCPGYRSFRSLYLPRYYCSWPNRQKLYKLLKSCDKNLTIKFCRYLNSAWKLRLEIIQWTLSYCSLWSVCFFVILYVHVCYSMYVLFANKEFIQRSTLIIILWNRIIKIIPMWTCIYILKSLKHSFLSLYLTYKMC